LIREREKDTSGGAASSNWCLLIAVVVVVIVLAIAAIDTIDLPSMSSRIPVLTPNYNTVNSGQDPSNMSQTSSYRGGAGGVTASPAGSDAFDTRKRQSRRDEAIRKKIESQLNLKTGKMGTPTSNGGGGGAGGGIRRGRRSAGGKQIVAGTVSALRPLPALTVPQNISVADASQLCAAKRTDCVLVVDDDEHLAGIFTAKDLAFRVSSSLCKSGEGRSATTNLCSLLLIRSSLLEVMLARHLSVQS
jgi:CBS domain-containing protein